jgi:acetyl esterase/lipase
VTDLTLSGSSWSSRASSDPYFTKTQVRTLVESYLAGHDPTDPLASPLQADLKVLAPLRVHVGNNEVLLDDSVHLVERAVSCGVDARLDAWEGVVHGFLGGIGHLDASTEALQLVGRFLVEVLA